ncbi:unnamed protein product, partial [Coregonus sp. 'balchen']
MQGGSRCRSIFHYTTPWTICHLAGFDSPNLGRLNFRASWTLSSGGEIWRSVWLGSKVPCRNRGSDCSREWAQGANMHYRRTFLSHVLRVGKLELDLETISAQLDQVFCSGGKCLHRNGPSAHKDSLTPCQREDHNMTSQLLAQAVDKGKLLKLYQARFSLQETHRETLATQIELHGSKQEVASQTEAEVCRGAGLPDGESAWETDVQVSGKEERVREESAVHESKFSEELRLKIHEVTHSKPGPQKQIKEENQMTALVIELQELRRVCKETSSTRPVSPKDQRAREWLERAALIKDCVGELERNSERLDVPESQWSSLGGTSRIIGKGR